MGTRQKPKTECSCGTICPKTDPPETLLPSQSRGLQYWACYFGVTDDTIRNWFEDEVQRRGGRVLLTRQAVESRYPDAFPQEVA